MHETSSPPAKAEEVREALIVLLEQDDHVRRLVLDIVASLTPSADSAPEPEAPAAVVPDLPQACAPDPLREQLGVPLALLETLRADEELSAAWLHEGENEGQQLTRLLATAAQWESLLELWDLLAERCKSQARPGNAAELHILEGCLAIHNLIWRDRQAQLCCAEVGAEYDYRLHQRTTLRGDIITAQWLPGLANAGGERQRLPLAAAE
ncbi:hypothetical protein DM813_09395 [Pseudomonas alkylphenolica]|uniref:Uncharacterized protein n=1 Tax=Pseudomonas alkylphenolica TaxID=237609 RepID=A0A443ZUX2_9PSED|nr:hypothetical protein [Pseudomonas alkylphenolica]RWU24020.1 hypothetical protein DM813_09395 [Pseudomonas alkylphenolica]